MLAYISLIIYCAIYCARPFAALFSKNSASPTNVQQQIFIHPCNISAVRQIFIMKSNLSDKYRRTTIEFISLSKVPGSIGGLLVGITIAITKLGKDLFGNYSVGALLGAALFCQCIKPYGQNTYSKFLQPH